ncbi:MAG: HIT family protein [Clostridia bacterium]|nr:HIT family protein [Clostridia bacterium]
MSDNCIFCKILKGEIPSAKIYEDELTYAFLDISGDFYGHTLVIPKKHCANVLECDPSTLQAVMETTQLVSKHYVDNCGFTGVNLFNNSGVSAEQSVMHLHFHIVPRSENDGYHISPINEGNKVDLSEVKAKLEVK